MSNSAHCLQRLFGLLLITAGLPALAVGQVNLNKVTCKEPNQLGALVVTVEAKQSSPPGVAEGVHLVVAQLPSETQINVPDAALKAAIKAWVDSQNSLDPSQRRTWILDGKNIANLFISQHPQGLKKTLESTFTIAFTALEKEAASPAQQGIVSFCFASAAPPATVKTLDVLVSTRRFTPGPPPGMTRIALAPPGNGVTAHALVSQEDFTNDVEKNQLLTALGAVAKTAWTVARKGGLVIGSAPSNSLMQRLQQEILDLYNLTNGSLPGFVWPGVNTHIEFVAGTGDFILKVSGVTMARSARIQVDLGIIPGTAKGRVRANKLAGRSEARLKDRFAGRIAALSNVVPTFDQIDSLSSDIAVFPEISPSSTPVAVDQNDAKIIVFHANNRWIGFGFKLSAKGGYSPEEQATGALTFEGDNLLPPIPDNWPGEPKQTESLSYTGGNEVQKLNALWAIDWTRDHASQARSTYGVHLAGDYLQDSDQRFGNLQGPPFRDREHGVKLSGVLSFRSRPTDEQENPLNQTYGLSATAGMEYRRVNVDPSSGGIVPPLATGTMTAAFLDLTLNYRYEPVEQKRGGIGGLELTLTSNAIHGFRPSDFAFTQVLVSGQGTFYFGPKHPRDFFLRFRQGLGTGNGGTPLFKLFRLGGPDILRGIEQGEFVGRKIGYQQFEAGMSVRQIMSWFAGKPKAPKSGEEAAKPPVDLSKIYLKGFYDRGRVSKDAGFSDLLAFRHAAKGYGLAVEMQALPAAGRRITLSIGYARSPDSVLHRSGLAVTGVSINF